MIQRIIDRQVIQPLTDLSIRVLCGVGLLKLPFDLFIRKPHCFQLFCGKWHIHPPSSINSISCPQGPRSFKTSDFVQQFDELQGPGFCLQCASNTPCQVIPFAFCQGDCDIAGMVFGRIVYTGGLPPREYIAKFWRYRSDCVQYTLICVVGYEDPMPVVMRIL